MSLATTIRNAAKSSPWLVIAIGIHVVIFAVLSVMYIAEKMAPKEEPPATVTISRPPLDVVDEAPPPPEIIDRKAIPKNSDAEIVSYEEDVFQSLSETAPDPNEDLHLDRGDPNSVDNLPPGSTGGTSIGTGGVGHFGTGVPAAFASRRLGGGGKRGRNKGVTEGTEAAVLEGMRWLLRHQNDDGSWGADTLVDHCSTKAQCVSGNQDFSPANNPGLTALSLLAFLGCGYGHDAKQQIVDTAMGKRYIVGDSVKRGLKWLVDEQGPDGSFTRYPGTMYNEAIAALALSEAYAISGKNKYWKEPAERAINYLVSAQKANPMGTGRWGWRYTPGGDSIADTSVTGWVVMAFKSAAVAGIKVPAMSMDGAMDFAQWVTGKDGLVGYLDPAGAGEPVTGHNDHFDYHVGTMSSLGMVIRTFVKHDATDPFLELAAAQIAKDLPRVSEDHLSVDYYYWYYGTLALNQFDGPDSPRKGTGKYWEPWNKAMQEAVLSMQDKNKEQDVCSRGGWLTGDRWTYAGGPIYCTAINVLTLEVYYRYANAFGAK
jgi:hypothetical protein